MFFQGIIVLSSEFWTKSVGSSADLTAAIVRSHGWTENLIPIFNLSWKLWSHGIAQSS